MKKSAISRRRFLGNMTKAMLAAAIAPRFLSSRAFAAGVSANDRINVISIGTGGQGSGLLRNFLGLKDCQIIGICDPYGKNREKARAGVKAAYGSECAGYVNFEEALAVPSLDAVVIATPDHWHSAITLAAVKAGKAVYCEKPLALSLNQNRAVQNAVNSTGAVFQYGTMQRSMPQIQQAIELVRSGVIGDLKRVDVWASGSAIGGSTAEIPVPADLDYNLYTGPANMRPCTASRITNGGSWYCSDYALGFIAGWGAHPLDVAVWGMDSDLSGPYELRGSGRFPTEGLFDTAIEWDVEIAFADGLPMHFFSHGYASKYVDYRSTATGDGTTFFGPKGWVSVSRGVIFASNPDWLKIPIPKASERISHRPNYYQAFIDSARYRTSTLTTVNDAVRSDAISHLANMVARTGETIVWDPKAYEIRAPKPFNRLMDLPTRGPWATT